MERFMKNKKIKVQTLLIATLLTAATPTLGFTSSFEDKTKDLIEDAAESFKRTIDTFGENFQTIQNYLDSYRFKGLIQDEATFGAVTLKHMKLNGHDKAVVVKPGERISAHVECNLDKHKCAAFRMYRVLVGIKGEGAQIAIGNELGVAATDSIEKFELVAPSAPGLYQIRFKLVKSLFKEPAMHYWLDEQGKEPDGSTTIGVIFVKA